MNPSTSTTGPVAGIHTYAGDCPICGQAIMAEQRRLPHLCPTCKHPLRSADPNSPWHNVLHCLKLYFDPRGRSTRREFWAFTISALVLLGIEAGIALACWKNGMLEQASLWPWLILPALLICPFMMVTVRRLHDLGKNATLLIVFLAIIVVSCSLIALHSEQVLPEVITASVADWAWALLRADIILGSIILYLSTQHRLYGPNQYGPAPK
ncbi:MAG: DUF805 domain-containing protein [Akkermansia sp.]|nr:DUF805 domain-containing protein [Akkermansia sp.]